MKVRAGSLPPLELHRVQEEQIDSMPIQYADDENEDGPMESLAFIIVLVLSIGSISIWMFV